MGLFDSPREREGPGRFEDILKQVEGLQNFQSGTTDIGSLRTKYGLTSANDAFNPMRKNLANRRGQALASASSRMSGRVANPEAVYSGVEGEYANAMGDLEGQAGQAELGQQQFGAGLLDRILSGNTQFGLNKLGLKNQVTGNYLNSLSDASTFDDILAGLGTAAKIALPFVMGPLGLIPAAAGAVAGKPKGV